MVEDQRVVFLRCAGLRCARSADRASGLIVVNPMAMAVRHWALAEMRRAVLAEQRVSKDLCGDGPPGGEPILVAELEMQAPHHTRAPRLGRGG